MGDTTQKQSRGFITITSDVSVVSITFDGHVKSKPRRLPTWRSIRKVDFISVPSMDRYVFCSDKDRANTMGTFYMYSKIPSASMLQEQCDKCSGPHLSSQKTCSANLHVPSPLFKAPPGFYSVKTGKRLERQPQLIETTFSRSGTVARCTFVGI